MEARIAFFRVVNIFCNLVETFFIDHRVDEIAEVFHSTHLKTVDAF